MKRLKDRIDGLPLILCGPILRRTQPDSVTVWLALRKAREVSLEIFAIDGAGERSTTASLVGQAETIALGDNLHIVALTASGGSLEWGQCYGYDLNFGPASGVMAMDDNAGLGNLFTHADGAHNEGRTGIYANGEGEALKALTFPDGPKWPSFVLPPDADRADGAHPLDRLRVCHGSCRKAHGEGLDSLADLDEIIARAVKSGNAADPRPHMLLLTGDQIYADDVADALLAYLIDAGHTLFNWSETLPGHDAAPGPGFRAAFGERLGLTAMLGKPEYGKSHLLHFAEYAVMYLFAWSDVLWPHEWDHLVPADLGLKPPYSRFYYDKGWLKKFQSTLPKIRRALANVPTYMIFDDHEISDDWNLNLQWVSNVLDENNRAGRRVVMNGLLAYAIFQAWGNTPWLFEAGGAGHALLNAATKWRGQVDAHEAEIVDRLKIPVYRNRKRLERNVPVPSMHWHYTVETPNFLCVVLDTRTMRGFPGERATPPDPLAPPELLTEDGFAQQIDQIRELTQDSVMIVVATTNVFGERLAEKGVSFNMKIGSLTDVEKAVYDNEHGDAWIRQSVAFERLLARLADRAQITDEPRRTARIIFATGDVHYGFAARGRYWGEKPFLESSSNKTPAVTPVDAIFAQFTASSFRNENELSRGLHYGRDRFTGATQTSWVGWGSPVEVTRYVHGQPPLTLSVLLRRVPAVVRTDGLETHDGPVRGRIVTVSKSPDWRYRVDYIKGETSWQNSPPDRKKEASAQRGGHGALAALHRDRVEKDAGTLVVGCNNIGELRFHWGEGDDKMAVQTLWWRIQGRPDQPALWTKYQIPLGVNEKEFPKPSYPGEEAEK